MPLTSSSTPPPPTTGTPFVTCPPSTVQVSSLLLTHKHAQSYACVLSSKSFARLTEKFLYTVNLNRVKTYHVCFSVHVRVKQITRRDHTHLIRSQPCTRRNYVDLARQTPPRVPPNTYTGRYEVIRKGEGRIGVGNIEGRRIGGGNSEWKEEERIRREG